MSSSGDYRLGRGYLSGVRLNLQHYCWKDTLGYTIHPSIPVGANSKIADVGTGTGVWLCDLSQSLPKSVQLDGFDVSNHQFPVSENLPSNVKLYEQDATSEPPKELQGQYDIVHLRLFLVVVSDNNPLPLLEHCYKLLKPGGYLQWDEHDPNSYELLSIRGSPTENLKNFEATFRKNHRPISWVKDLPAQFERAGFSQVLAERPREHPWQRRMNMENLGILGEEFATNFLDRTGPRGSGDELRQLNAKAHDEVKLGTAFSQVFQVVVGKKEAS